MGIGSETLAESLESENVRGIGFVEDLNETLATYKVFVCPMMYGAGMKGKIGVAASAGIPVVTTSIGIEGFPMIHDQDCLIADEAEPFARACLKLMRNADIWDRMQKNAAAVITEHFSPTAVKYHLNSILPCPTWHLQSRLPDVLGESPTSFLIISYCGCRRKAGHTSSLSMLLTSNRLSD